MFVLSRFGSLKISNGLKACTANYCSLRLKANTQEHKSTHLFSFDGIVRIPVITVGSAGAAVNVIIEIIILQICSRWVSSARSSWDVALCECFLKFTERTFWQDALSHLSLFHFKTFFEGFWEPNIRVWELKALSGVRWSERWI